MSQQTLSTPNKLTLSGDNAQAWKSFKQRFELYVLAAGYTNKSDAEKIALLLTIGGDELIEIYNSFEFPEAEPNANGNADITVAAVIEKFNEYFSPRSNELTTPYKFRKCVQRAGE